jgi:magnesium-transporting ATPase (P-type)
MLPSLQREVSKVFFCSNENLLLAGALLKNTREVYAVCVYAGTQTKISLNSKITKNKFSTIERSLNRYLLFLVGVLVTEIVSSTVLAFSFNNEFYKVGQYLLYFAILLMHPFH